MARIIPVGGKSPAAAPDSLCPAPDPHTTDPDSAHPHNAESLKAFARERFPNLCPLKFSELHDYLFERRADKLAGSLADRRGQLDVTLAPRGSAKTTLVSLLFPLHALFHGLEPYIVLICATQQMAERRIANLRQALSEIINSKEIPDFRARARARARNRNRINDPSDPSNPSDEPASDMPDLSPPPDHPSHPSHPSKKPKFTRRSIDFNNCRLEAHSYGTEIRGLLHNSHRPTWIILDDVERGDRVRSGRQRENVADWFAEVVENLGATGTHIDLIGTLLHPEALPARLMNRSETHSRIFKSIIHESANPDLWDQWREIYHNLADPDRAANARAFYLENRAEMDDGAKVLWPDREDYYDLNVLRERIGRTAFEKEKQNAPQFAAAGVFDRAKFGSFERDDNTLKLDLEGAPEIDVARLRKFAYLDPATGNADGDYAALVVVGLDPLGRFFVLEAWLSKATPSAQVQRIYDLHAQYNFERFGIETNSFQRLYLDPLEKERERRRAAGLRHDLAIEERRSHRGKLERVLTLEPLVDQKLIFIDRQIGSLLLSQLEDFPQGSHDDGPDALAGAVELARRHIATKIIRLRRKPRGTPEI